MMENCLNNENRPFWKFLDIEDDGIDERTLIEGEIVALEEWDHRLFVEGVEMASDCADIGQ